MPFQRECSFGCDRHVKLSLPVWIYIRLFPVGRDLKLPRLDSRNCDALTLASRQGDAAFAKLGFEPLRQPTDKFGGVGENCCTFDLCVTSLGAPELDVLPCTGGAKLPVPAPGQCDYAHPVDGIADIDAIERNYAALWV